MKAAPTSKAWPQPAHRKHSVCHDLSKATSGIKPTGRPQPAQSADVLSWPVSSEGAAGGGAAGGGVGPRAGLDGGDAGGFGGAPVVVANATPLAARSRMRSGSSQTRAHSAPSGMCEPRTKELAVRLPLAKSFTKRVHRMGPSLVSPSESASQRSERERARGSDRARSWRADHHAGSRVVAGARSRGQGAGRRMQGVGRRTTPGSVGACLRTVPLSLSILLGGVFDIIAILRRRSRRAIGAKHTHATRLVLILALPIRSHPHAAARAREASGMDETPIGERNGLA